MNPITNLKIQEKIRKLLLIGLNDCFLTSKNWGQIKKLINDGSKNDEHLRSWSPDDPISDTEKPDDYFWSNKDFQKEKLKFKYALDRYKNEIETLKKTVAEQYCSSVLVRKDYLREVQMLRESLALCGSTKDRELIAKYKQSLKVHYFNELEGVDAETIKLMNARISIIEKDCEFQLASRQHEFFVLTDTIAQYRSVSDRARFLVEIKLPELFTNLCVLHPNPNNVLKSLLEAYPKDAFRFPMQEALSGSSLLGDKVLEEINNKVNKVVEECNKNYQYTLLNFKEKMQWVYDYTNTIRSQLMQERKEQREELRRQQEIISASNDEMLKQEKLASSIVFVLTQKELQRQIVEKDKTIMVLRRYQAASQCKSAFAKWLMLSKVETFMISTQNMPEDRFELYRLQFRDQLLANDMLIQQQKNSSIEQDERSQNLHKRTIFLEEQNNKLKVEINKHMIQYQMVKSQLDIQQVNHNANYDMLAKLQKLKSAAELKNHHLQAELNQSRNLLKNQSELCRDLREKYGIEQSNPDLTPNEQAKNCIDIMFRQLKSNLLTRRVIQSETMNQAEQELLYPPRQKQDVDCQTDLRCVKKSIRTEIVHENRVRNTFYLIDDHSKVTQQTQTECGENVFNYMMQGAHAFNVLVTKKILKEGLQIPPNVNELYEHILRHSQHGVFFTHDHIALVQTVRSLMDPTFSQQIISTERQKSKTSSSSLEQKQNNLISLPLNIVENLQPTLLSTDRLSNFQNEGIEKARMSLNKKHALDAFEMYVELINLLKTVEPQLVTNACRVLKKTLFPNFSLKPFQTIMSLYPEFTPDVFYRLWHTRLEPKEQLQRQQIADQCRKDWRGKLLAQDHLDEPAKPKSRPHTSVKRMPSTEQLLESNREIKEKVLNTNLQKLKSATQKKHLKLSNVAKICTHLQFFENKNQIMKSPVNLLEMRANYFIKSALGTNLKINCDTHLINSRNAVSSQPSPDSQSKFKTSNLNISSSRNFSAKLFTSTSSRNSMAQRQPVGQVGIQTNKRKLRRNWIILSEQDDNPLNCQLELDEQYKHLLSNGSSTNINTQQPSQEQAFYAHLCSSDQIGKNGEDN